MGKQYKDGVHGGVFYATREMILAIQPKKRGLLLSELLNLLKYDEIEIYINDTKRTKLMNAIGINTRQRYSMILKELREANILTVVNQGKYIINPNLIWYGSIKNKDKAVGYYEAVNRISEKRTRRIR